MIAEVRSGMANWKVPVSVVVVVAAGFGGWKLFKKLTRSEESKQLEERQDRLRSQIGDGLDDLFSAQLDADTKLVQLVATLEVDRGLAQSYEPSDCAKGFHEAFEDALGPDVIEVSTAYTRKGPRLELAGAIRPSGREFVLPHEKQPYPGISLDADVKLGGKSVHVTVEPGSDIKFEVTRYGYLPEKTSANEVAAGIFQATCKQAGYEVLAKLTSWKRPAPAKPADPMAACESGFHCVESGDELAASDPAKAAKLYATACQHDDPEACTRLGALALESSGSETRSLARVTLEMACHSRVASACADAAQVTLIPYEAGTPVSASQKADALTLALRGCDLGASGGCSIATGLVKGTLFAEAAKLLVDGAPVATKKMGTLFAFHWGQWTKMDNGQPTLWVTKKPAGLPPGAIVRAFSAGELPVGITAPAGAATVYAIALDGGHGGQYDGPCERCASGEPSKGLYAMASLECVCMLTGGR